MSSPVTPADQSESSTKVDPFIEAVRILVIQIAIALSMMLVYLVCVNFYASIALLPVCVPVTGFAVAAILLRQRQLLTGMFAGLVLARIFFSTDPVWIVILLTLGNVLEVVVASWLLRAYHFSESGLESAKGLMALCLISMLVPAVSCLFIAVTHWLHPATSASVALAAVNGYWLADAVSTVQVISFALLWCQPPYPWKKAADVLEGALWLVASCLLGQIIFLGWLPGIFGVVIGGYWMFLVVLPVAVRIGCHGVALVQIVAGLQGMAGTALGVGFLAGDPHKTHLINLWSYLGILTLVGMAFSIVLRSRINNENQLRQSRQQLLEAQRLASLAVWSWDLETDRHYWSPWIYEFYGRDPALGPAVYPEVQKYFTAESWLKLTAAVEECLKSGAGYECEAEVIRPDGGRRWIIARGEAKRNDAGVINSLIGTVQDITARKMAQLKIASTESNFRALFENSPTAKLALDSYSGKILRANQNAIKLWGYSERELQELTMLDITFVEDRLISQYRMEAITRGEREDYSRFEKRYLKKDSTFFWAEVAVAVVRDDNDRPIFNIASVIDTTERKRIETQISQLTMTVEQSPESIVITDTNAIIEYVNESYVRTSGYSREELIGQNSRILQSGKTPRSTFTSLWQTLTRGDSWEGEFINRSKDGVEYIEHAIISPIRRPDGTITHYAGVKENITEKIRSRNQMHRLAYFDPVTELPNLMMLQDHVNKALQQTNQFSSYGALITVNLDRFKTIADANGQAIADQLLKLVGERLVQTLYASDVVARVSGDEFCILLPDLESSLQPAALIAMQISQKIHSALRRPLVIDGREFVLTSCHGIALLSGVEADNPNEILRRANTAMHHAKSRGYEQSVFFDKSLEQMVRHRFDIEGELRHAIRNDELRIYLQSQVDAEGNIQGAEALLRWQHPGQGLIGPINFIPVAEESNLIIDIDNWVLGAVCRRVAMLPQLPLRISVNISARHFNQVDFVDQVRQILSQSGANPSRLTLEITEGVVIGNIDEVISKMLDLGTLGMHFSMDDFGTGYSSLSYLKRLPIHELKIDRSFIMELTSDANDAALVEGILAVTKHLKLRVVAEGVETIEQAQFLNQRAKVLHQGYLYSRPEPMEEWLAKYPMPELVAPYQFSRRFLNNPTSKID